MSEDYKGADFPGRITDMTFPQVKELNPNVVVLPLGSTEPHGEHLPLGTDTYQVSRLCELAVEQANAQGGRVLLYPTLPITNNVNVKKFPFALRVGIRTLMLMLIDIVEQCGQDGIEKVLIVNGHGGNPATIDATLREISGMDNMPFCCWLAGLHTQDYKHPIVHPSDHGGEDETSRMMWIRPDLVDTSKLKNYPIGELRVPSLGKANFVRPWHLYVPESAGGETKEASAKKGQTIIEDNAKGIAQLLVELSESPLDENFPYKV